MRSSWVVRASDSQCQKSQQSRISIQASSDTLESGWRQKKQWWIKYVKFFCICFWRATVCWPFCIFERCLDLNPESCHSKQARATNLATYLSNIKKLINQTERTCMEPMVKLMGRMMAMQTTVMMRMKMVRWRWNLMYCSASLPHFLQLTRKERR